MRASLALLAVVATASLAGCLEIAAATVPDSTLEAKGWVANATASSSSSSWGGISRTEIRVYDHPRGPSGYAGTLTMITLRAFLEPGEEDLRDMLRERTRAVAEENGIAVADQGQEGARENAEGKATVWFVDSGTATSSDVLFTRDADVRIVGEVWNCRAERTAVVAVGLAQVNDVRSIGGILRPENPDTRTFASIVADPKGTVDGHRGNGLLYSTTCG